jgi:hypothetical protein
MGKWGADEFVLTVNLKDHGALYTAVQNLNAKARQAFYGAAMKKGNIAQGTWNGCAFNAGGDYVGVDGIHSYEAAAEVFGLTPYVVQSFISAWDSYRPKDGRTATEHLIEMLEKVGLFKDNPSIDITTYRYRVYTSEETRMIEELRAEIENGELLEGMNEACDLFVAH